MNTNKLRELMHEQNLTQVELGEKINLGQEKISMILNGKRGVKVQDFKAICLTLNVAPEELW